MLPWEWWPVVSSFLGRPWMQGKGPGPRGTAGVAGRSQDKARSLCEALGALGLHAQPASACEAAPGHEGVPTQGLPIRHGIRMAPGRDQAPSLPHRQAAVPYRFTSGCAERTPRPDAPPGHQAVHLRLRGADESEVKTAKRLRGSPPPARCGQQQRAPAQRGARFTSACAERTTTPTTPPAASPVHLRLRGADLLVHDLPPYTIGSPPPARSGRLPVVAQLAGERFTSACAERTPRP